jgi:hypothetical protein
MISLAISRIGASMRGKIADDEKFIERVERLIDPAEVSDLFFFQSFKRLLPAALFKALLARTSRKTPYMGFVIEPYSLFLFFKLKDIEKAKSYLPDRYELQKARIFADDEPEHLLGMGVFNTRASAFWGTRHESYLIARDKATGLLSWIFIDILSDTLIALPAKGVSDPNCAAAIFTTNSKGEIFLDVRERKTDRRLKLKAGLNGGTSRRLDEDIWVMGNTSIAHSKQIAGDREDPFAVIFDPAEVERAIDIPVKDVVITENNLFPGLAEETLCKAICFPFAQHYIADSPGCRTYVKNPDDMVEAYARIAKMPILRPFSTKNIRRLFFIGIAFFPILSVILLILLLSR